MTAPYLPRAPRQPTPQEVARALGMVPMAGAPNLTPDGVSPYAGVKAGDSQGGTGWAARLFGGSDPLASGLLSAPDARGLGRDALRNFGIALLQNSGPAPYRRGLGEILGTSLQQGQHAYETGVQGTLAQRQLRQQQAEQQRIAQQRQELASLIGQNPERLAQVFPQIVAQAANGDENARAMLGPLSNYLNQPTTGNEPTQIVQAVGAPGSPNAGKKVFRQLARDGRVVSEWLAPAEPVDTAGPRADRRAARMEAQQWLQTYFDPTERKNVRSYWQAVSHLDQAQRGNPAAYKPAISAFVANAEPNNRVLLGMLRYLEDVDPSVEGKVSILQKRLAEGAWPPEVLQNLRNIIESNFSESLERYKTAYEFATQDDPEMAHALRNYAPDIAFGTRALGDVGGSSTTGGSGFRFTPRR